MALIKSVRGFTPKIGKDVYLADNATVIGDVVIGDDSSIWFNTVLRGDVNSIRIGKRVNIQDGTVVHTLYEKSVAEIGDDVSIGHNVTIHGAKKHVEKFAAEHDEYNKIMVQILADRFVEAFAECLHQKTRKEFWGYDKNENLTNEQMIKEEYKGIRPAPGYPACPDHTEKIKLFELLNATENIGVELTESLAMNPPASVCGWYIAHPQSHYFGLGKISRDQLEDYAKRKGMSIDEAERWLRPNLEY